MQIQALQSYCAVSGSVIGVDGVIAERRRSGEEGRKDRGMRKEGRKDGHMRRDARRALGNREK